MPEVTRNGKLFAEELARHGFPQNFPQVRACSVLCRRAKTYKGIQERWCNIEMDDKETARWERKEARLEELITEAAQELNGVERVEFRGDPRGYTVALYLEGGKAYNTWGGAEHGLGVRGS